MNYKNLVPVTGTIINVSNESGCCSKNISLRTPNGIVNFIVSADTLIIDSRQLRIGLIVAAFYDKTLPVPLIFPPRYQAQLVTAIAGNEQIMLNFFDRNLRAADNSLQLNISGQTIVRTSNGQNANCNLGNRTLLVYYTNTTRSIPPQTTPRQVIVMC